MRQGGFRYERAGEQVTDAPLGTVIQDSDTYKSWYGMLPCDQPESGRAAG